MKIIDAHAHLWKRQHGLVNGRPVVPLENGKSDFGGSVRQMLPPYMTDGENSVERFLANMDYAGVNGAVLTQEEIDGNQNGYYLSVKERYPHRFKICSLYQEGAPLETAGFDGVKICAGRLKEPDLTRHFHVFQAAAEKGQFVSIDLADGHSQAAALQEIIDTLPHLKIAVGHFGMVTRAGWEAQVRLAQNPNVFLESGGITWLFHKEFYPYPSAVRAIQEAASICGMRHLMWGSDYPRTMVAVTYRMSYDFILKSGAFSKEELEQLFYANALHFYGFAPFAPLPGIPSMLEDE